MGPRPPPSKSPTSSNAVRIAPDSWAFFISTVRGHPTRSVAIRRVPRNEQQRGKAQTLDFPINRIKLISTTKVQ